MAKRKQDAAIPEVRGEYRLLSPSKILKNPWNPNVQSDTEFRKLCLSIRKFGFGAPLIVRCIDDDQWQVIDGEHRWSAAISMRMPQVPVVDLGVVEDAIAKQLTIISNELSGSPDQVRLSQLLGDLAKSVPMIELEETMPFPKRELDAMIAAIDFDFDRLPAVGLSSKELDGDAEAAEEEEKSKGPAGKIRKLTFQLDPTVHKEMDTKLAEVGRDPNAVVVKAIRQYHKEEMKRRKHNKARAKDVVRRTGGRRRVGKKQQDATPDNKSSGD